MSDLALDLSRPLKGERDGLNGLPISELDLTFQHFDIFFF